MGDRSRFREFARFVGEAFPEAKAVADVAGGRGELAYRLLALGKEPTIVDPADRTFPGWIHREIRKRAARGGGIARIPRICSDVRDVDLATFDLVVAMHPDEATEPMLRAALAHGADFAVVPCCVFPLDGVRRTRAEWVEYLASLAPGIRRAELPITGANVVLWRKRDPRRKEA